MSLAQKKKRRPYVPALSSHGVISSSVRRTGEAFGGSSQHFAGFCVGFGWWSLLYSSVRRVCQPGDGALVLLLVLNAV